MCSEPAPSCPAFRGMPPASLLPFCSSLLFAILAVPELLHSLCAPGSPIISRVCVRCAGINQTHDGGSCLIQLFYLNIAPTTLDFHNCFFSALTFTGVIKYSFSGPQVRQLFLPLIFAVSLSEMPLYISPSHLHVGKSGILSVSVSIQRLLDRAIALAAVGERCN